MQKGFTLIELMVTITIIGILSSVVFSAGRNEQRKLALGRASYLLTQDLREMQEMAMGAGEADCDGVSVSSFGVHFKQSWQNYYILFADCNDNQNWDGGDQDSKIRQVTLEKGVKISNLKPASSFSVVFQPPDPTVYINQQEWDKEAEITLQFDTAITKTVKINSAGRIEIE